MAVLLTAKLTLIIHLFELKLLRMRIIILICFGVVLEQWDFDPG